MWCEQCIRESRIINGLTRPHRQNHSEIITGPEDTMQIDLVPELTPSGGFEDIVAAMDVFSRHLLSYPTSSEGAKTVAKFNIHIINIPAYLPTLIILHKRCVRIASG